jgi:signal transduction histidine kinase
MADEIDAMGAMLNSILSFARDDAKREPGTLVDFDALAEGVCEDASDAGASVTYTGVRGVTVSGRPAALRRAISNLIDNAVKYGGGAEATLKAEGRLVVLAVDDHGPGIPRSEREKVFEPFYRIEGSRNPETGGVGLGLAVARSIAREHGGDIVLAARKGGGLSARLECRPDRNSQGRCSRRLPIKRAMNQTAHLAFRPPSGFVPCSYRWMLTAASRITSYTRRGWESIGTWLDATSVTLAFIRFARKRCSSGCMVRSLDPTI